MRACARRCSTEPLSEEALLRPSRRSAVRNITCCPDPQELQRFSLDQLPAAETERLERHLNECGACRAALEQLASANKLAEAARGRS